MTKSLIIDLNFYVNSFSKMPLAMQRSFCEKIVFFEGVAQPEIDQRIKQLLAFFSSNSVPIDLSAFSYKENPNKNPGADVIESALEKIGVPAILHALVGSRLEFIFQNDVSSSYKVRREIKSFRSYLFSFPYRKLPNRYVFNHRAKKDVKNGNAASLWHTYINEMMNRRHSIVHGDTMANETTVKELKLDIEKMEVLMHALLFSAVAYLTKKT